MQKTNGTVRSVTMIPIPRSEPGRSNPRWRPQVTCHV